MRAGKPGTETSAPNTSLNPPLNPSRLPSLTLTGLLNVRLLQLLLMRQLLHPTRHDRCFGLCLCGGVRTVSTSCVVGPPVASSKSIDIAARSFCCPDCTHLDACTVPRAGLLAKGVLASSSCASQINASDCSPAPHMQHLDRCCLSGTRTT